VTRFYGNDPYVRPVVELRARLAWLSFVCVLYLSLHTVLLLAVEWSSVVSRLVYIEDVNVGGVKAFHGGWPIKSLLPPMKGISDGRVWGTHAEPLL